MKSLTLFSFGYWGSGSATPQLLKAFVAAERARGFKPPHFVDIRISRASRTKGFNGKAFETLVGKNYTWMPRLGNVHVLSKRGPRIQINDPSAAKDLLDLAQSDPKRRVIFYCACGVPAHCHRHVVGGLVIKEARKRGMDVTVVEWPGGEPKQLEMKLPPADVRKLTQGKKSTLPMPSKTKLADAMSMPWGSVVSLRAGEDYGALMIGPAQFDGTGATFPILQWCHGISSSVLGVKKRLKEDGYIPRRSVKV